MYHLDTYCTKLETLPHPSFFQPNSLLTKRQGKQKGAEGLIYRAVFPRVRSTSIIPRDMLNANQNQYAAFPSQKYQEKPLAPTRGSSHSVDVFKLPPKRVIKALKSYKPTFVNELAFSEGDFFYVSIVRNTWTLTFLCR